MKLKTRIQDYLSKRPHKAGETVQYGWFIFRVAEEGKPPRLESLDFKKLDSFTEDFTEAEKIHDLQVSAAVDLALSESPCTLWHSALVSKSYTPGREDAFLERQEAAEENDSGWYVGVFDEELDMDDVESFTHRSLYELTLHDMRMAPYWLLTPGTLVSLSTREVSFEKP